MICMLSLRIGDTFPPAFHEMGPVKFQEFSAELLGKEERFEDSQVGRHSGIGSVDDVLRRADQLAAQDSVEWHDLLAEFVLKSLKLTVSGCWLLAESVESCNSPIRTSGLKITSPPNTPCRPVLVSPNIQLGRHTGFRGLRWQA